MQLRSEVNDLRHAAHTLEPQLRSVCPCRVFAFVRLCPERSFACAFCHRSQVLLGRLRKSVIHQSVIAVIHQVIRNPLIRNPRID